MASRVRYGLPNSAAWCNFLVQQFDDADLAVCHGIDVIPIGEDEVDFLAGHQCVYRVIREAAHADEEPNGSDRPKAGTPDGSLRRLPNALFLVMTPISAPAPSSRPPGCRAR